MRKNTLMVLTHLILNDMMKVRMGGSQLLHKLVPLQVPALAALH